MKDLICPARAVLPLAAREGTGATCAPLLDGTPTAADRSDLAECRALARDQLRFDRETIAAVLGAGDGAMFGAVDDDPGAAGPATATGSPVDRAAPKPITLERRTTEMHAFLKHRRHRFDALHALLTGASRPSRNGVPPNLRRDLGLPETLDTRRPPLFDPTPGAARRRD